MKEKLNTAVAKFSAIGVYLLIAFEFFYMASPFAMYFYSVYKPGLGLISRFPFLAWMTGFFMPHLVVDTKSALLSSIPAIGAIIAITGFLLFLICAIQIYYAKLFQKKAVTGGIYKYVRHPQYAAFALCSFGLLLLWPRYLTLFFYVTLLFVYYWLARKEEKECLQKFGDDYAAYMAGTAMFFPLPAWFRVPERLSAGKNRINILVKYVLVTALALLVAVGIEMLSIKHLYAYSNAEGTWLSIYKTDEVEFKKISGLIQNSGAIDSLVMHKAAGKDELISYVLPAEMYISEIPMMKPDGEECHVGSGQYDHSNVKIVITKGIHGKTGQTLKGSRLIQHTLTLQPLAEVWVDTKSLAITRIVDLPESERYTNIPEPVF